MHSSEPFNWNLDLEECGVEFLLWNLVAETYCYCYDGTSKYSKNEDEECLHKIVEDNYSLSHEECLGDTLDCTDMKGYQPDHPGKNLMGCVVGGKSKAAVSADLILTNKQRTLDEEDKNDQKKSGCSQFTHYYSSTKLNHPKSLVLYRS